MRATHRFVRSLERALLSRAELERLAQMRHADEGHGYDVFGMHPDWLGLARSFVGPLYRHYFRVSSYGTENIPNGGPAILIANHAGTLPIDAAMISFDVFEHTHPPRMPRAVIDYFVPQLPFAGTFLSRVGAVHGALANVRRLIETEQLCLIFPEGMRAIGKPFRQRYTLTQWRVGHAELALRYRIPIIPVAVIGSEEQWLQLGRLERVHTFGMPYLPVVATPIPLPVHYHIHYGAPLHFAEHTAQTEPNKLQIERAAEATKQALTALIARGLQARKSLFR
jgi:1-acyl-sn-glycerol-3-phosphate acyltransferase